jgi:hypothetical protein
MKFMSIKKKKYINKEEMIKLLIKNIFDEDFQFFE